jgi:ribonuclease HI
MKLDLNAVCTHRYPSQGPWTLEPLSVSFSLHLGTKSLMNPQILKDNFLEYLSGELDSVHIYTDGSKDRNGVASAAVSVGRLFLFRLHNEASIFTAESRAIILALKIIESTSAPKFIVFSDSLSCLQAIQYPSWKNPVISEIIEKTHILSTSGKQIQFCWLPSHVGIRGNEAADVAAKAGLQLEINTGIKLPYSDLIQLINVFIKDIWQHQWNSSVFNKLKIIKPMLGETILKKISSRRDEVVLHQARIGHTFLTHAFLLHHEDAPECRTCQCLQTVQHILLDCPDFTQVQSKYF